MNNLEWLIANAKDNFGCGQCVKQGECSQVEGDLDESECANGHIEWLMQPHESTPDGDTAPVSVSDEREPAESESAAPTDADSREKLEHDIRGSLGYTTKDVFGWLDRQAKITEIESDAYWAERIEDLEQAAAERADLKKRIEKLLGCLVNDFGIRAGWDGLRKVWLTERAENAAETHDFAENPQKAPEQQRICRTCRWFEPEKWVKTGNGTENFRHAKCHHGPGSFATDADDWCGEWSA